MLKVRYGKAADFLADYTENVSEGGLFIATQERFEMGTILDFEISFPGLLDPIQLQGEVKWYRPASSSDEPAGIGVQFLSQAHGSGPLSTLVSRLNQPDSDIDPETDQVIFTFKLE